MTERKPPEMSFTSWIDKQISEAEQRGAFENLPGTGKPLPNLGEANHGQVWLRDYLRREGVSSEEVLPAPLKLRKQRERLTAGVQNLRSEQEVRDAVHELNRLIIDSRRNPEGPPIFVPLVSEEAMVDQWKGRRAVTPPASLPADAAPEDPAEAGRTTEGVAPSPRGWWYRLRRRGRP